MRWQSVSSRRTKAWAQVVEINRVVACCGVESLFHQIDLLLLKDGCDVDLVAQAQEDRSGIFGQTLSGQASGAAVGRYASWKRTE
jgi:hypothetical protein